MKKILIFIIIMLLLFGACAPAFNGPYSFRGHELGDSLEDIIEKEGREPYFQNDVHADFDLYDFYGDYCFMSCKLDNNSLYQITVTYAPADIVLDVEAVYDETIENLSEIYGKPDATKSDVDWRSARWIKKVFGCSWMLYRVFFISISI